MSYPCISQHHKPSPNWKVCGTLLMCYYKIALTEKLNVSILTNVHDNKALSVYTIPFSVKSPSNRSFSAMSKKKDEPTAMEQKRLPRGILLPVLNMTVF